jgi:protein TonB
MAPKDLGILPEIEVPFFPEQSIISTDATPPPPAEQQSSVELQKVKNKDEVENLPEGLFPDFKPDENIPPYEEIPVIDDGKLEPPPPIPFSEVMPEPVDGFPAMYTFLKSNLVYPEASRKNGIYGQVFVRFVVEKDGTISNVKIVSSVHPELDREALRVVKMLPKWKPGSTDGKPVRCLYQIPIRFSIY